MGKNIKTLTLLHSNDLHGDFPAHSENDIIEEYLTTHQQLDREIEGRLNVVM